MDKALKQLMALAKEQKAAQKKEEKRIEAMERLHGKITADADNVKATQGPLANFMGELENDLAALSSPEAGYTDFDLYISDVSAALKRLSGLGKAKKAQARWVADQKAAEKARKAKEKAEAKKLAKEQKALKKQQAEAKQQEADLGPGSAVA